MTLQDKKEQLAEIHWNLQYLMAKSEETKPYIIQDFISGFEAADPIGFMEWVWSNECNYTYSSTSRIWWHNVASESITTSEIYLKFLEYKQTLKH